MWYPGGPGVNVLQIHRDDCKFVDFFFSFFCIHSDRAKQVAEGKSYVEVIKYFPDEYCHANIVLHVPCQSFLKQLAKYGYMLPILINKLKKDCIVYSLPRRGIFICVHLLDFFMGKDRCGGGNNQVWRN